MKREREREIFAAAPLPIVAFVVATAPPPVFVVHVVSSNVVVAAICVYVWVC
jgi:hypothetical protein